MSFDSNLIKIIGRYTPEKVTTWLYQNNILESGKVIEVQKKIKSVTLVSYIVEFKLSYSKDASSAFHDSLLLKVSKADAQAGDFTREADFYNDIAESMEAPPVPLCLNATYDAATKTNCILMMNLEKTHFDLHGNYPLLPSIEQCGDVVEKLAEFHSKWWEHDQLNEFKLKTNLKVEESKRLIINTYNAFCNSMNEWFNGPNKEMYNHLIQNLDILFTEEDKNTTVIHGDAHFGNVLYPKKSENDIVFIDWADWMIGKPMDDLAYMMALRYFPEQRKIIEQKMIEVHNKVLISKGIEYSLETSIEDYKKAVAKCLLIPIFQWQEQLPPEIWYYNMERIISAFKDLNCEELFY